MSDAITLVMPLQAKAGVSVEDFYTYWLNAHVTLPARFPGIDSIFLHQTSFDQQRFPRVPNTTHRPESAADDIHGIPEATFATFPDLQVFIDAAAVQWQDAANFIGEEIDYRSLGESSQIAVDKLDHKAPTGFENHVRHMVFLRKRPDITVDAARAFVSESLVPTWAKAEGLLKLRSHLFEPIENTLESPDVRKFKKDGRHYDACVEVVFPDDTANDAFASSAAWRDSVAGLEKHFEAVHALRATRTFTSKYKGQITLLGSRGALVIDILHKLNATSQYEDAVTTLFIKDASHNKIYHP